MIVNLMKQTKTKNLGPAVFKRETYGIIGKKQSSQPWICDICKHVFSQLPNECLNFDFEVSENERMSPKKRVMKYDTNPNNALWANH